jgi:hypothetical protein
MDYAALQQIVASNSRERGASALCSPLLLEKASRLFLDASRVLIVTGFYIRRANAPETDGPPGAVALGRALARAGKHVLLMTDKRNCASLEACARSISDLHTDCVEDPEKMPMDMDLLVFIERPGQAADGRYYNMKGADIGDVVAPLDKMAAWAMRRDIAVLGIGDGGNEAGMGPLYDLLAVSMPHDAPCLSRVPATVCLPVDVSNWGAYALTAALSVFYRRWLGLDEGEEEAMLQALLRAGAVDGVTGVSSLSVDGVELRELNEMTLRIKNWYLGSFEV